MMEKRMKFTGTAFRSLWSIERTNCTHISQECQKVTFAGLSFSTAIFHSTSKRKIPKARCIGKNLKTSIIDSRLCAKERANCFSTKSSATELKKSYSKYATLAVLVLTTGGFIYYYYGDGTGILGGQIRKPATLNPFIFNKFKLMSKENVTADTALLRFQVQAFDGEHSTTIKKILESGIWSIDIKDHFVQTFRSYTPIDYDLSFLLGGKNTDSNKSQYFDIIVKRYSYGNVSKFIHEVPRGEQMEIRAPCVTFPYFLNRKKNVGMIAGGTGIAPMFQLASRILSSQDPEDLNTRISIVYGSRTNEDIYLKSELETLADQHPGRLKLIFLVDGIGANTDTNIEITSLHELDPSKNSSSIFLGRVSQELVKQLMPTPELGNLVLVSGPDSMMRSVCGEKSPDGYQGKVSGMLGQLGYTKETAFKL